MSSFISKLCLALNGLLYADVSLRSYSLLLQGVSKFLTAYLLSGSFKALLSHIIVDESMYFLFSF